MKRLPLASPSPPLSPIPPQVRALPYAIHFLPIIAKSTLPMTVCLYATGCADARHYLAVSTLTVLLWHLDSRRPLQTPEFAGALVRLVTDNAGPTTVALLALCVKYLCLGHPAPVELVEAGALARLEMLSLAP